MAIRAGRRGLATAVCAEQKQTASLNLARAYLLHDDPFSANNALFENRDSFNDDRAKNLASLLGAYARFIGVKNKAGMLNARNRLFSAIAMIPDSEYASFADGYFAAHAFQELGFTEHAVDKYLLALSRPDIGAWQRRILYELALAKKAIGETEAAMSILQSMVDRKDDPWNRLALRQIAEIFAESKQTSACIETCKKLWQSDLNDEEKQAVLHILGIAYQQQGEHYSAALCFAGILPDSL
jgi:tetratricopeptide (TPR) repeat protein